MHRVASYRSPQGCGYNVSLHDIYEHWSIDDVMDANDVLDLYDKAYEKAMKEADSKRK